MNNPENRAGSTAGAPQFVRAVGLLGLIAISLNGVIGSGIFVLPATVAGYLGAASPVAYLVAALATTLIVVCFAEAGSIFNRTGGPYLYAREAFGSFIGFEVGWVFFLTRLTAAAAIGNAFTDYLGYLWPPLSSGVGRVLAITALVAFLARVNYVGVRSGSRTVNVLTIAKLLPLLLFICAGLFFVDPARYRILTLPDMTGLRQASLALIFAFGGFENASVPTEEVKDPTRNLPIALLVSIAATTVIYVLIQVVALGTLPGLATDPTPLSSAGRTFLGPAGAVVITIGAVLSTSGSKSALMLVGPRILYAFGEGRQLPAVLARLHPKYNTPYVSILLFAFMTWIFAVWGSFVQLAVVSAMARLLFSVTTCLAVPVLRRKMPTASRKFRLAGGPVIPILAVGVSLWLLSGISKTQAIGGVAALVVGAVLYLCFREGRRQGGIPPVCTDFRGQDAD
jgi:basic amino acid/polyamine antiporter, APA family